jgi:uncharacterized protein with von Willebrand factor type A (vWA) domain
VKGSTRLSGSTRPGRSLEQVVRDLQRRDDPCGADRPYGGGGDTSVQAQQPAGDDELQRAQGGASRAEALHDRSLSQWLPQDLALLERLAERIAESLRRRLTRRWQYLPTGRRLDVRRTLRQSLATAGIPVRPAWKTPRRERRPLFILVDVSRSMETHAQLFLRIARAFVKAMDARVFVFHTRLAEVTPFLRSDSASIQEKVNAVTAGFGGGTRIATSLGDFRGAHVRGQLGRGTRVWILSDAFDADEPGGLRQQLLALRQAGASIDWFHPSPRPPASRAMQRAIEPPSPVARFHRLDSLRDLERIAAETAA